MTDKIVATEVAEDEFERFLESMDIDADTSRMDEEDRKSFDKLKARILRAMEKGALVINEDGEAVYTPQNDKSKYKEPLTFHERTGADLMAMDSLKKGKDMAKTYAVMAGMCRVDAKVFSSLVGIDGKVCEAVFMLLMD